MVVGRATVPDASGAGGAALHWDRLALQNALSEVRRAAALASANGGGGIRRTRITYRNTGSE